MSRNQDPQPDHDGDLLLDALLDEILADNRPPDLKSKILERWDELQQRQEAAAGAGTNWPTRRFGSGSNSDAASHRVNETPVVPKIVATDAHRLRRPTADSPGSRSMVLLIASCVCAAIAIVTYFGVIHEPRLDSTIAEQNNRQPSRVTGDHRQRKDRRTAGQAERWRRDQDRQQNDPTSSLATDGSPSSSRSDVTIAEASRDDQRDDDQRDDDQGGPAAVNQAADRLAAHRSSSAAADQDPAEVARRDEQRPTDLKFQDADVVVFINQRLAAAQELAGVSSGTPIADEAWCERTFNRLIGRSPGNDEVHAFLDSDPSQRRSKLVDRLLGPEYEEAFAQHWANRWSGWLLNHSGVRVDERKTFRIGLNQFLADSLKSDASYRSVVRRLLTAIGSNDPNRADYDPATNFLLATLDQAGTDITARVGRTIMGQRVRCAQCHNDPSRKVTQEQFWTIAAVFQAVDFRRLRVGRGRIVHADRVASLSYEKPDGTRQSVTVDFADADSDSVAEVRQELARQFVVSEQFAEAAVNRFWSELLTYGFTFPIDDLGDHNAASHPQLVSGLANRFESADFDLRRLLKWIALSDAFDRSKTLDSGNFKDFPDGGSVAYFTRDYYRPTVFSQPIEGLSALASGHQPQVAFVPDTFQKQSMQARRLRDLNDDELSGGSDPPIGLGQLMPISYLRDIRGLASTDLPRERQIEHAFLMVLSRQPTDVERAEARKVYEQAGDNDVAALERIFWALLNCDRGAR